MSPHAYRDRGLLSRILCECACVCVSVSVSVSVGKSGGERVVERDGWGVVVVEVV